MTTLATCATLAAIAASAPAGSAITLPTGADCANVTLSRTVAGQVTINLGDRTLRTVRFVSGSYRVRGGTIRAVAGPYQLGPLGYGAWVGKATVRFDAVTFTDANRGLVLDGSRNVIVADSCFVRLGADGIIASAVQGLTIVRNRFADTLGKATECDVPGGVVLGLSGRDCAARGGVWRDGYHADAVQLRNGITDALIADNVVRGRTQGIGQQDGPGDAPMQRVRIERNDIETDDYHRLTLTACVDCLIRDNRVARAAGSTRKAVIIAGTARACGNRVDDQPKASAFVLAACE